MATEQVVLTQPSMDDAFPGFEDLQNFLEPRQESCGFEGKPMEPPPGLALGASTCDLEPKYVSPKVTEIDQTQEANSIATAKAVAAILEAQKQLSFERGVGKSGPTAESAMLAEVVRKAIGSLRNKSDPLDGGEPELDLPMQRSKAVTKPLRFAAPPPGLRTELRSSARVFNSTFTQQPSPFRAQPTGEFVPKTRISVKSMMQPRGEDVPKPSISLESALPMSLPTLPAKGALQKHLTELEGKDPRCVLLVQKIQRLGHGSDHKLKGFFEWYGPVESVLVSPSHVRSGKDRQVRLRPADSGFVIMGTAQGALDVLADGESHNVAGVTIEIQKFEMQSRAAAFNRTKETITL